MADREKPTVVVAYGFRAGEQMAHAIATTRVADALAGLGYRVVLIAAGGREHGAEQLRRIYGLENPVEWLPEARHLVYSEWFAPAALTRIAMLRPHFVYTRDPLLGIGAANLGFPSVVELHPLYEDANFAIAGVTAALARASRRPALRGLIVLGERAAGHYEGLGVAPSKIVRAPCGVDRRHFARPAVLPPSPYPSGRPVVVYCGHLYDWKGIPTVLGAAARLPNVSFHLVGGHPEDVSRVHTQIAEGGLHNVTLHGMQPYAQVPSFLWHADLILVPTTASHWTADNSSPLKLGEAFAAEVPVVASAIPAIAELGAANAVCGVHPDDPAALAGGIERVLSDRDLRGELVAAGRALAASWDIVGRARMIADLVDGADLPTPDAVYRVLTGGWLRAGSAS